MTEEKEKDKGASLGSELKKVQNVPMVMLAIRLEIKPETAMPLKTPAIHSLFFTYDSDSGLPAFPSPFLQTNTLPQTGMPL